MYHKSHIALMMLISQHVWRPDRQLAFGPPFVPGMRLSNTVTDFEQQNTASSEQYRAELLRQRAREARMQKQQEKIKARHARGGGKSGKGGAGGGGGGR